MSENWLANLKVGDEVLIRNSASRGLGSIQKVERVTKTQIKVLGCAFNRETGRQCGTHNSYHWSTLYEVTSSVRNEIRLANLRKKVDQIDPSQLSAEQCAAIMEITTRGT